MISTRRLKGVSIAEEKVFPAALDGRCHLKLSSVPIKMHGERCGLSCRRELIVSESLSLIRDVPGL